MKKKPSLDETINSTFATTVYSEFANENMRKLMPVYVEARDNPTEENKSFREKMEKEIFPLIIETSTVKLKTEALKNSWPEEKLENLLKQLPNVVNPSDEFLLEQRNKVDIGCPICKTRLVFVKQGNYETLDEHVGHPNGYINKKDAFGCPNKECQGHGKLKWLAFGEGPYGGYKDGKWEEYKYIDNNHSPFRTFHRQMEAEKEKEIHLFKIKKVSLYLKYHSRADENGKKNWLRTWFRFQIIINGRYYTSGLRMFIFSIKQFSNNLHDGGRVHQFKNAIKEKSYPCFNEWWRVLSFNIAKVIWKKDYDIALKESK